MSEFKIIDSNYFILFSHFSFSFILFLFFGDLKLELVSKPPKQENQTGS